MLIRRATSGLRNTTPSRPSPPRRAAEATTDRHVDRFVPVAAPPKRPNLLSLDKLMPKVKGSERTEADALAEARDLLLGGPTDREENGAEILRDAPKVNSSLDTSEKNARHVGAETQLEANAELEEARLAGLTEEDRASYDAVKQRCLDAGDPVAALALQTMLFEGKLPGEVDRAGEGTTLDHLAALGDESTELAAGVDRDQLVCDLVQELATPSAIDQGGKGTCAPTTIAIQLALENPAEYARITAGLASPGGEVVLAGGQTLKREFLTARDDGSRRSAVQRLMAPAFMEMANGDENYVNRTDDGSGATSEELDVLYEAVMGRPMSNAYFDTDEERAGGMDIIDTQLRAGATIPAGLEWDGGYHKVLVTGTETVDGQEYVTYINPWGREERMPREDFEARLTNVNYDPWKQLIGTFLARTDAGSGDGQSGDRSGLHADAERARRAIING